MFLRTKAVIFETTIAVEGQHYRTKNGFSTFPAGTTLKKTEIQEKEHLPKLDFFSPIKEADLEDYFEPATEAQFKEWSARQNVELEPWATPEIEEILKRANQPHPVIIEPEPTKIPTAVPSPAPLPPTAPEESAETGELQQPDGE